MRIGFICGVNSRKKSLEKFSQKLLKKENRPENLQKKIPPNITKNHLKIRH